jgi:hypothetical protein
MSLIDDAIAQALAANQPSAAPDPANTASSVLDSFNPAAALGMQQQLPPQALPGSAPDQLSAPQTPDFITRGLAAPPPNDRQLALAGQGGEHDTVSNPTADLTTGTAGYQPPMSPDKAAAERDTTQAPTTDFSGTAGYDPNEPQYTPLKQPAGVADATRQADDQMSVAAAARQRAEQAKLDATKAYQTRMADASQRAADEIGQLNNTYNNEQAAISAKADSDTATWLQDLKDQATREPNPSRWWRHQGGLGRALWGLSMAFGALNAGMSGGKNAALEMVQKEVDADMGRQDKEIQQTYAATKERGQTIHERVQRQMDMARDRHTGAMTRLSALERAWQARAAIPGDLDAQAAKAAAQSWFDDQKMNRAEQYRTEKVAAAAQEAARRFQAGQAAIERKFRADQAAIARQQQIDMENLEFAHKLALSPVEVSGAETLGRPGMPTGVKKDGTPLAYQLADRPQTDGGSQVKLADAKGNTVGKGVIKFRDRESWDAANGAIAASDKMYNDAIKLRDKLKDNSKLGTLAAGIIDPETEQMVAELGMSIAQAQNGHRISDKDYDLGVRQAVGFNPDGSWTSRGKFALGQDTVIKMLNTAITNHHVKVEAQLQQYNDTALNGEGSKILYRPADLSAPEVPQQNAREVEGKPAVVMAEDDLGGGKAKPLAGVADYQKRVEEESADTGALRGRLLPDHDRATVEAVIKTADQRGPATIRAKAAEVLAKLKTEDAQLDKTMRAAEDPWNTDPPSHEEAVAANYQSRRIHETEAIVKTVADDLAKKAEAKLRRFENRANLFGMKFSTDTLKKMARDEGLTDASEVADIIAKFKDR